MKDDLYARHQMLVALMNVLLHDLRNPLHNATLLVEARSLDSEVLRTKLKAQFGKLEGILGVATNSVREWTLEPRVGEVGVDGLLRLAAETPLGGDAIEPHIELPPPTGLTIVTDEAMLARALSELVAHIAEESRNVAGGEAPIVKMLVDEQDGNVSIRVGELPAKVAEPAAKASFSIAGGGVHLALARALSQT
ncbi:MAG TPA: hypothetical protein VGL13_12535, partial [Polyangiaceae bacterium]